MSLTNKIREYLGSKRAKGNKLGAGLFVIGKILLATSVKIQHVLEVLSPKRLYRQVVKSSIFFRENEMGMCSLFPQKILAETLNIFHPQTVLDLGCGTGKSLDYFRSQGISVIGVEGSKLAKAKAKHPELIWLYDLNQELDLHKKFDLVWSFEFVEHIHPKYVDNLIKTFTNHAKTIVLSAARPGQGGEGHFNEQPAEYWVKKIGDYGYQLNAEATQRLQAIDEKYSKNMLVFQK